MTIIPVSEEKHGAYADKLAAELKAADIRVNVDKRGEKMGYLIRDAQTHKIPYTLVVGEDEMSNGSVSVRKYGEDQTTSMSSDAFVKEILADIASYSREND